MSHSATQAGKAIRPVLFFDVNETLLDLTPVRKTVGAALGGRDDLAPLWFATLLQFSLVSTVADRYRNFDDLAADALRFVAAKHDIALTPTQARRTVAPLLTLPPYPEVAPALRRLQAAGFRLFALSNSSKAGLDAQIRNAELSPFFEGLLSVEDVGVFKPHSQVYRWAIQRADASPAQCWMVAAHGWDVAGALWSGLSAAFVSRPGQHLLPHAPRPQVVEPDLSRVTDRLLARSC